MSLTIQQTTAAKYKRLEKITILIYGVVICYIVLFSFSVFSVITFPLFFS